MFVINLSRIGRSGTGMWQYSLRFLDVLSKLGVLSGIICSQEHEARLQRYQVEIILVPSWVTNTSKISNLRPLLWFIYSFWLAVKLLLRRGGFTLVSTTHHGLPFLKKQVITVHDVRPYDYPDSRLQQIYFHRLLPRILQRCQHVLTVSESVRKKIADYYAYPEAKISVIYNAVDTVAFSACTQKDDYLLAVGASWRHKHIDSLLKVSVIWSSRYHLVIVAGETDYVAELKSYVKQNALDDRVTFRHGVPFAELIALYQHATALVYPSLDEGFGIPPVEALSCLTPVIVSDIPVFHEVLSDAAIYVQPNQVESWRHAFSLLHASTLDTGVWRQKAMSCSNKYNLQLMSSMVSDWLKRMSI